MKRLVLLSTLLILVFALAGCASSGTNGDTYGTLSNDRYEESWGSADFQQVHMRGYYR